MENDQFVVVFSPTNGDGVTYIVDCEDYSHARGYMKDHHPDTFSTHARHYRPGRGCDLSPPGNVLRLRAGRR